MDVGEPKTVVLNKQATQHPQPDTEEAKVHTIQKCEVTLIDETCGHFPMILWNEDLILFALRVWKSKVGAAKCTECFARALFLTTHWDQLKTNYPFFLNDIVFNTSDHTVKGPAQDRLICNSYSNLPRLAAVVSF